jgi:hypothetical protein
MADTRATCYEFAMGFVAASNNYRSQFTERWREVAGNFSMEPEWIGVSRDKSPYRYGPVYRPRRNQIVLKDPETHKVVMTYAAKLVRAILGDPRREYIQAKPVGWEDAPLKAPTTTRLLRYAFALPGHFRTFVESIVDMLCYGTSVVEVSWKVDEREMPVRSLVTDPLTGMVTDMTSRQPVLVYDDVVIRPIDVMDFYPDPSRYRMLDMQGAAKRFKMNVLEAKQHGESGFYNPTWVQEAFDRGTGDAKGTDPSFRQGLDQPHERRGYEGFKEMIGYEYWGQLPERMKLEDETGKLIDVDRGVITVLNNVVVRTRAWPYNDAFLPFHSLIINPVQGCFYGKAPAEIVRYDQSFADAVKILLAEAIIRRVHPPIAFDGDADVDVAALQAWKADALVMARGGPNAVGTLKYDADLNGGMGLLNKLKVDIQEGSGALGGIQGEEGPDREAATVGMKRIEMALDRPELAAMVLEDDCFPPIGKSILRRYQQFLHDEEDLQARIGELPESAWLGDIMGDFDVELMGSRKAMSRQMKLQSVDRLTAMSSAIPALQMRVPWDEIATWVIGDLLELPEIAAKANNPNQMMATMLAMQMGGGGGAGRNQIPPTSAPPGILPQQAAGGVP